MRSLQKTFVQKLSFAVLFVLLLCLGAFTGTEGWAQRQGLAPAQTPLQQTEQLATKEYSLWSEIITWVRQQQRAFHVELTKTLTALKKDGHASAAWTLVFVSFLYGFFHAAGPGHGKAILTTYLVTQKENVARGIKIAFVAAFVQGLSAIALVYGFIFLAGWLPRDTAKAVDWSEKASFLLLMLLGIYLFYRSGRALYGLILKRWQKKAPQDPHTAHSHDHDHDHHIHNHHDHHHAHDGSCCGHQHAPSLDQIQNAKKWREQWAVVFSIGLRPCTGAILVLVFAKALGLITAGLGAVAAMSLGTGLAIGLLAFVATHFRRWTEGQMHRTASGHTIFARFFAAIMGPGFAVLALLGSVVLFWLGLSLLLGATAAAPHPLGL